MERPSQPLPTFISYAREDASYLAQLETHLTPLKRQGWIEFWTDQHLRAGDRWEELLLERLRSAKLILLLISPDFLASDFIFNVELKLILERYDRSEVRLIPILVRPAMLLGSPLERLQPLPYNGKAITEWESPDAAWMDVISGLRKVIGEPRFTRNGTASVVSGQNAMTQRRGKASQDIGHSGQNGAPESDSPLTLVQLADLHFGQERREAATRFNQQQIITGLLEDIGRIREQLGSPDYILITGDIAFTGQQKEYDAARAWLTELSAKSTVPADRILMVPGNHDVDRTLVTKSFVSSSIHKELRDNPKRLDDLLQEDSYTSLQATLWPKLEAYARFAREFGAPVISAAHPWWTLPLETPLGPVVALGLNSCLTSFDERDSNASLALSRRQRTRILDGTDEKTLLLALSHHPPECLNDGPELLRQLQQYPHILLVGHTHQRAGYIPAPLRIPGEVRLVAGASRSVAHEDVRYAYTWLRVRAEGIECYPRTWNQDRQRFQAEVHDIDLPRGQDAFQIPLHELPNALQGWHAHVRDRLRTGAAREMPSDPRALSTHLRPRDRILVVNFQGIMPPPELAETWEKLHCDKVLVCAPTSAGDYTSRLRSSPIDRAAWEDSVQQVASHVREICQGLVGSLHVFVSAPYALAAWLGRCIDESARLTQTFVYQFDGIAKRWQLFIPPQPPEEIRPYFRALEQVPAGITPARHRGILISIEIAQPATEQQLERARDLSDAALAFRLGPAQGEKRYLGDLPVIGGALEQSRTALERLRQTYPGEPIQLLTSAPLAFVVEVGRWLRSSVYGQVFIHHFDASEARYYPVLDVVSGRVWSPPQLAYVSKLSLAEFKRFRRADVTFGALTTSSLPQSPLGGPGWFVLAGRNSSGKSSLLQGIALALLGADATKALAQHYPEKNWAREGVREGYIDLFLSPPPGNSWNQSERIRWKWQLEEKQYQHMQEGSRAIESLRRGIFFAAYGPFRRLGQHNEDSQKLRSTSDDLTRVLSLFLEDTSLREGWSWIIQLKNMERAESDAAKRRHCQELLALALDLVHDGLLPDPEIRITEIKPDDIYMERRGERIGLNQLSDGYRCVISLVLDLLRLIESHRQRFLSTDPRAALPVSRSEGVPQVLTEGIVLIDEIDAHLHISWQRQIGSWLTRHFPCIQFIVTTHSPYICQAASEGGLIRLPAPNEGDIGPENITGDDFNTITSGSADEATLTKLFGLERTWSDVAESLRTEVAGLEVAIARGRGTVKDLERHRELSKKLPSSLAEEARALTLRLEKRT